MIAANAEPRKRFYRDADRACLGGVCAGLAGYFGFNLKMTRFLAFIAFLMAMPAAVIAYLAAVFLIPSASSPDYEASTERHHRRRRRSRKKDTPVEASISPVVEDINRRCQSLDGRLIRLEKLVTSKRFQLEQELNKL